MRKVVLTLKENQKYLTIKKLVETKGNKKRAATHLGLSVRHINRLIARYKLCGKKSFVHGNRGKKPVTALSDEIKDQIEDLYITKYFDCTYTHFTELLAERENINLSITEVGQILRERFILSPRSHRVTRKTTKKRLLQQQKQTTSKKHFAKIQSNIVDIEDAHPRQPRCINFGEEVQIDASEHIWFGNQKSHLHAAVDDSTGQVLAAYFDKQETLNGYYNIYYQILNRYRHSLSF